MNLTLYSDNNYFSPYVMSVFVALSEKDIPFTLQPVDLAGGVHIAAPYAALSLTSRAPTLQLGDFALSESSAIVEYLDEAFPAPQYASVYPVNRELRARARQIQAWLRSDLLPIREERSTDVIFS